MPHLSLELAKPKNDVHKCIPDIKHNLQNYSQFKNSVIGKSEYQARFPGGVMGCAAKNEL